MATVDTTDSKLELSELIYAHIVTTVAKNQISSPTVAGLQRKLDKVTEIRGDLSQFPRNWVQASIPDFSRKFFRETPIGFDFEFMMWHDDQPAQYVLFYYKDGTGLAFGLMDKQIVEPSTPAGSTKTITHKPVIRLFSFGCKHKFITVKPKQAGNSRDVEIHRCTFCGFTVEVDSTD